MRKGCKAGSAKEFVKLTEEQAAYLEVKLVVSDYSALADL